MTLFSREIQVHDGRSLPSTGNSVRSYVTKTILANVAQGRSKDEDTRAQFKLLYHPVVTELINRSDIYLAVYPEDTDVFMGFLVADKTSPAVHYVYVRSENRKDGIAKELVNAYKQGFAGTLPKSGTLWAFTHMPAKKDVRGYLQDYVKRYNWHAPADVNDYLKESNGGAFTYKESKERASKF